MNIIKANEKELYEGVTQAILSQTDYAMYCVYDKPYVVTGCEIPPNYEYIKEHNIEVLDIPTMGGTIVVGEGDLGFGLTSSDINKTNGFLEKAKNNLLALIKKHGYEATTDNNDILIDGYKVASYCSKRCGNVYFGVFQVSMNVDLNLINNISNKEMVKVPKSLSSYGLTSLEIEKEVVLKTAAEF